MMAAITSYRRYALTRCGQGLAVIGLAYLIVFFLLFLLPGDPVRARLSDPEASYSPEQIDQLVAYYGLDQPIWTQLWHSLSGLARGDLGFSLTTVEPVGQRILTAAPATFQLGALTLLFAIGYAGTLVLVATIGPWKRLRTFAAGIPATALSVPTFVIGLLVLQIFSYNLGLFSTLDSDGWLGAVPAAMVLALPVSAPFARVIIDNVQTIQREPYVTVAKSKGLGPLQLLTQHVARPAALPGLTMVGLAVAELITGSVIVESIFNRHGLGSVIESAVSNQDSPVLLGVILLAAVAVVGINLGIDLLYPLLDPRLRPQQPTTPPVPAVVSR